MLYILTEQQRIRKNEYLRKYCKNNREKLTEYYRQHRLTHNKELKESHRMYYRRDKDKLFEILGGKKCVRCGFTDERALQFDHINGGGSLERKEAGTNRFLVMKWVKDPDIKLKIQVLCANCNWIKRYENKEVKYITS